MSYAILLVPEDEPIPAPWELKPFSVVSFSFSFSISRNRYDLTILSLSILCFYFFQQHLRMAFFYTCWKLASLSTNELLNSAPDVKQQMASPVWENRSNLSLIDGIAQSRVWEGVEYIYTLPLPHGDRGYFQKILHSNALP